MSAIRDFWRSCGHHLLDRNNAGNLLLTDEFLKAYLARPELIPPRDACLAEHRLHDALLRNPRRVVSASQIEAIADRDARENWEAMVAWRDHLVGSETLEAAYLRVAERGIKLPHVFIDQLVHVILRNILDDCDDAFVVRAAEMFFRPQKLLTDNGSLIAIDEEMDSALGRRPQPPLVALLGLPVANEISVLNDVNADHYWEHSDRFDMGLALTADQRGWGALGEVTERWISHLLAVDVAIKPITQMHDAQLSWYLGFDSEATRIGDALWNGDDLDNSMRARLIGLFELTFRNPQNMVERVKGRPVHLFAAMTVDNVFRLKPQNLLTGLPISCGEAMH